MLNLLVWRDILIELSTSTENLNLLLNDNNQQRPNRCVIRIVFLYACQIRFFNSEFHLPLYHPVTQHIMIYSCSFLLSAFAFTVLDKLLQLEHFTAFVMVSWNQTFGCQYERGSQMQRPTHHQKFCTTRQDWNSPPFSRATGKILGATIRCFARLSMMVSHPLTTQNQHLGTTPSPQVPSSWCSEPVPSVPKGGGCCFSPDRTNRGLEKQGHIHRGLEEGHCLWVSSFLNPCLLLPAEVAKLSW